MSKVVNSPSKYFTGHVVISDPLTLPMVAAFERSLSAARALDKPTRAEAQAAVLPGLIACVAEWHIDNLAPGQINADNWPGSPRVESALLIEWLTVEVLAVYTGEVADPNA